jgi:Na+/melibiose symporter-like transporter
MKVMLDPPEKPSRFPPCLFKFCVVIAGLVMVFCLNAYTAYLRAREGADGWLLLSCFFMAVIVWTTISLIATLRSVLRQWRQLRTAWEKLDALRARIAAAEKEQEQQ